VEATPLFQRLPLSKLKPNPNNPRLIKDERYAMLVQSLKDFPQMLELRPIVVDSQMVVLGGNQRLKAAKDAGMKTVPVIVADQLTDDQKRQFVIKDNVSAGAFSWTTFFDHGDEWDVHELQAWGLELPFLPNTDPSITQETVTDDDVTRAQEKLAVQYNDRDTLREVTCPHCGEDFHVNA